VSGVAVNETGLTASGRGRTLCCEMASVEIDLTTCRDRG